MKIRKATLTDASDLAKVQVDTWRTTYPGIVPDEFLKQMSYEKREQVWEDIVVKQEVMVAESKDGKVFGYAHGGKERTGHYPEYGGELYAIYVLKEHQGKGVGKMLFNAVVTKLIQENLFSMVVCALEENPACGFYESLGGEEIATEEIEISGERLAEKVYGWKDIRAI